LEAYLPMAAKMKAISAIGAGLVAIALLGACSDGPEDLAQAPAVVEGPPAPMTNSLVGTPERAGYPKEWRVGSIDEAAALVAFPIVVPDLGPITTDTLTDTWVYPNGAVALDYRAPVAKPESFVRQEYIEVFQAPWLSEKSPLEVYAGDLEADPDRAKSLVEISGVSALIVEAHSKNDLELANPAFVRFAVNGIEIQLSGGEDLELLLALADTMIKQANASAG
jgi:hypothetical protein